MMYGDNEEYNLTEVANRQRAESHCFVLQYLCTRSFLLSWGGMVVDEPLRSVATATDEVEIAPSNILHTDGSACFIKCQLQAQAFAFDLFINTSCH
jgi:hypothetical protein